MSIPIGLGDQSVEVLEVGRSVIAEARDNGHDMHSWSPAHQGVGLYSTCRRCGGTLKVKYDKDEQGVSVVGCNMSPCPKDLHGGTT